MMELELVLQLTYSCQLRCKYCYQDRRGGEIPIDVVLRVLEDASSTPITRINLYGGEPLLYSHIKDVLEYLNSASHFKEVILPTNGLLLPKYIDLLPRNVVVQVSVDGSREVTDYLRGRGVYDKVVEAIRLLGDAGINYGLGMVLNEVSKDQLPHLIKLAIENKAHFIHVNYQVFEYGGVKPVSLEEYRAIVDYYRRVVPPFILTITAPLSSSSYCFAGCRTFTLNPDLNYVACPRYPDKLLGKWPELPSQVIERLKVNYAVKTPCHMSNWQYIPL